jgi:signal transduction histidine kinase
MTADSGGATPVAPEQPDGETPAADVVELSEYAPAEPAVGAAVSAPPTEARRRRGLTIRLKLTLWCGCLFLLAGALLIGINYFLVRDNLTLAPGKAREVIAERYHIRPSDLEPGSIPGQPGGPPPPEVMINGVSMTRMLEEALRELRDEALHQLWTNSLIALAIIAVVTFGLAWLVAGRMLRPVHAITDTARRLSGSTLHERIALKGPRDELKDLADTFDDMLGRLDTAFTAQKEFVANASHELRTPLTIIRTEIDVALSDPELSREELQEMGTAVTEAVDRSEDLIDGLLVLASAESSPALVDLDLAEIAGNEVDLASSEADALGLRLELDLQPALVKGERTLLERMAGNLVENAVRHNAPDGWFSVKTNVAGNRALLEVANSGPVVSPEEVGRLFDRFYRPDKSRSRKTGGFGLGLSIVKAVATALDGSVDLVAPKAGGLRVTVSLPAVPQADRGNGS